MADHDDPLSRADFDPVAYINQQFPDEASLSNLDTFVVAVSSKMAIVESEISQTVQLHSLQRHQTSHDISQALSQVQDLSEKLSNIRTKASDSEQMVEEICADIKRLDLAKTHLQTSITTLKRLQMLMMAVNKLESLSETDQRRATAEILDAVGVLMLNFENYSTVPIIFELRDRVMLTQSRLKKQVMNTFGDIGALSDGSGLAGAADAQLFKTHLTDSCALLDSLGVDSRTDILENFVKAQLQPYEKLFGEGKTHFVLEQVERRWAWFKRMLKNIDDTYHTIFPAHWLMALRMTLEFTERTKAHLLLLLTKLQQRDDIDVHALLKALKSALRFEQEMVIRFELKKYIQADGEDDSSFVLPGDASQGEATSEDLISSYSRGDEQARKEEHGFFKAATTAIVGSKGLSGVFDNFLGTYVELEKQNLEEMLGRIREGEDSPHEIDAQQDESDDVDLNDEDTGSGDRARDRTLSNMRPKPCILGSSLSVFTFIKNSIKRCTTFSSKYTFLALSNELKAGLRQYADLLRKRCTEERTVPSLFPADPKPVKLHKLASGEELLMCHMINTGEYCADLVPSLEEMIKNKIAPELSDQVNFESEADVFMDLGAHALRVLVSGILERLRPSFSSMVSANWTKIDEVVLESQYVNQVQAALMKDIPIIRNGLSDNYFRTFCTKLASDALDTFLEIIFRQKRISETGAQQMLLDMYNIKTQLLNLHSFGSDENSYRQSGIPAMYEKLITTRFARIEVVLKLVGTPEDEAILVERFRIMWPEGQASDLEKIMALKGVGNKSRAYAQNILESFDSTSGALGASVANMGSVLQEGVSTFASQVGSQLGKK